MRHKSTELMEQINDYVDDFFFENGRTPSTTEIAKAVGIARGTAYQYLVDMDKRGMISYENGDIFTKKRSMVSSQTPLSEVFSGSVPCGPLEAVESCVEDYVQLPVAIFGSGKLFLLRTTGDSMIDAGIEDGDTVVVKQQETANDGDIVVALVDNGSTLKRLRYDRQQNSYYLHPENPTMDDIYVDDLQIQGVAKFLIKPL